MQVNTVTKSINHLLPIPPVWIGILLASLTGITIFGGVKKIAATTSKLIPLVTLFYLSLCLYIILMNFGALPELLKNILSRCP